MSSGIAVSYETVRGRPVNTSLAKLPGFFMGNLPLVSGGLLSMAERDFRVTEGLSSIGLNLKLLDAHYQDFAMPNGLKASHLSTSEEGQILSGWAVGLFAGRGFAKHLFTGVSPRLFGQHYPTTRDFEALLQGEDQVFIPQRLRSTLDAMGGPTIVMEAVTDEASGTTMANVLMTCMAGSFQLETVKDKRRLTRFGQVRQIVLANERLDISKVQTVLPVHSLAGGITVPDVQLGWHFDSPEADFEIEAQIPSEHREAFERLQNTARTARLMEP